MIRLRKPLLTMALSISLLCSTCAMINTNAFAIEDTNNSIVEEASMSGTDSWDKVSNYPDENGELRYWMDDLEDRLGSLTLTYIADDNNKCIAGAKVYIYKIASLTVKNGDAKYTLVDDLKKDYPNINFAGMSSEELDNMAKDMSNKDINQIAEVETDTNGVCKFTNLEPGLYLIKEKAKLGMAKDYEYFKPFIINVPFPQINEKLYNGHWTYDVESLPKTELRGKKKTLIVPPQTGDEFSDIFLFSSYAVFITATIGAVKTLNKIRKNKQVHT